MSHIEYFCKMTLLLFPPNFRKWDIVKTPIQCDWSETKTYALGITLHNSNMDNMVNKGKWVHNVLVNA